MIDIASDLMFSLKYMTCVVTGITGLPSKLPFISRYTEAKG